MALAAQKLAYGEDVVYSGPLYSSFTVHKNKVVLHFEHIGSGLISNDGEPLRWFAIAGEDQNFIWAHAEIQDNQVIVWHEDIKNPKFIRYAWADNPDKVNLFNLEGLPASPFEVKLK
jgi:sialate O-acetylesterase